MDFFVVASRSIVQSAMLLISYVNCCLATKPSSLVMFAAVHLLGKKSMSMSTIDTTDPITKSNVDKLMPILRKV